MASTISSAAAGNVFRPDTTVMVTMTVSGYNDCFDGYDEKNCRTLMVILTVVVVVQSNTIKSNVLGNFFFLQVLRFLWLTRPRQRQVEPCSRTFWGCTSGGVYVPCIYTHVRWVTAGDSGLCGRVCMTSLEPPCVLMLQKVLRVKSFLFACCFCFFALQNDDSWYWS